MSWLKKTHPRTYEDGPSICVHYAAHIFYSSDHPWATLKLIQTRIFVDQIRKCTYMMYTVYLGPASLINYVFFTKRKTIHE